MANENNTNLAPNQYKVLDYYKKLKNKKYVGNLKNADETLYPYLSSLILAYGVDSVVTSIAQTYGLDRDKYPRIKEVMTSIANAKKYNDNGMFQEAYSLQTLARALDTFTQIFLDVESGTSKKDKFPEGTITNVEVGALPANSNISNLTSVEVLEKILKQTKPITKYTCYYGYDSNLVPIESQSKSQVLKFNSSNFIKPIYKYPKSLGFLESITSKGGSDDYSNSFTRTEETINGVSYYVYTKKVESMHNNFSYSFN